MYYVSFIDDFSRNTWIYFLKKKFEVFNRFKEFKALVENHTEKKIKVLRTDDSGEFCSKEFEVFCKKCGIAWQRTTPYTPEKNGVAERMNKTLMERARSMLSGVGLGQEFWVEVVLDASACINMYCNIERNIMKNQAVSPGFGIQGKSLCIWLLCIMLSYCLFFVY